MWAHSVVDPGFLIRGGTNPCGGGEGGEILLLPPATKLGQGYVFTGICHSVNRGEYLTRYTPWDQVHPPRTRYTPRPGTPPRTRYTPPAQSMLADMVNARAVRILLECNLVLQDFAENCMKMKEIGLRGRTSLAPHHLDPQMPLCNFYCSPVNVLVLDASGYALHHTSDKYEYQIESVKLFK